MLSRSSSLTFGRRQDKKESEVGMTGMPGPDRTVGIPSDKQKVDLIKIAPLPVSTQFTLGRPWYLLGQSNIPGSSDLIPRSAFQKRSFRGHGTMQVGTVTMVPCRWVLIPVDGMPEPSLRLTSEYRGSAKDSYKSPVVLRFRWTAETTHSR